MAGKTQAITLVLYNQYLTVALFISTDLPAYWKAKKE